MERTTFSNKNFFINLAYILIAFTVLYGCHLRYQAHTKTVIDIPIRADAYDYYNYAYNISEHGIYSRKPPGTEPAKLKPDALRSPGFPAFASLFIDEDANKSIDHALLAQTLIQILALVLLTITFVKFAGLFWSLPFLAVLWTYPHFITANTYYLSESIFTSGLILFILIYTNCSKGNFLSSTGSVGCGMLLGFISLIRPVTEYLPWFIATLVLIRDRSQARAIALFLLSALIPAIAWKIRNIYAIGSFSDPTLMINALYHGSFPGMMYNNDTETLGFAYRYDPRAKEVYQGITATLAIIWERAVASPREYFEWYLIGKQFVLWQWGYLAAYGDIFIYPILKSPYQFLYDMYMSYELNRIIYPAWAVLGIISALTATLFSLKKNHSIHPAWKIMAIIIVYSILMHSITAPYPRYSLPLKPALLACAMFFLKEISTWITSRITKTLR